MTKYFGWSTATFLTIIIFLLMWSISGEPLTSTMFYIVISGLFIGWMLVLANAIFK